MHYIGSFKISVLVTIVYFMFISESNGVINNTQQLNQSNVNKNWLDDAEKTWLDNADKNWLAPGDKSVLGGQRAKIRHYPFMAFVYIFEKVDKSVLTKYCCGVIIDTKHIIVSGYCATTLNATTGSQPDVHTVFPAKSFSIVVGKDKVIHLGHKKLKVSSIVVHPAFYKERKQSGNVAVLTLTEQLIFDDTVNAVGLPTKEMGEQKLKKYQNERKKCTTLYWAFDDNDDTVWYIKKAPIRMQPTCSPDPYCFTSAEEVQKSLICGDLEPLGHFGAAILVCPNEDLNNKIFLWGFDSWCLSKKGMAIFTRVDPYYQFIAEHGDFKAVKNSSLRGIDGIIMWQRLVVIVTLLLFPELSKR